MIVVKFYRRPERGTIHMEMVGHSNAAPEGEDLVCAGATMMAFTVAQALKYLEKDKKLKKAPKLQIRKGVANIIATPTEEAEGQVLNVFWVAQCGCQVLAHNYPGQVRLEKLR